MRKDINIKTQFIDKCITKMLPLKAFLAVSLLICIWCIMYLLNIYTPFIADDYCISPRLGESYSLAQCFQIAVNSYFNWCGDIFCTFFQNLFGSLGDSAFNICNTSIFIVLILLIYYFIVGSLNVIRLSVVTFIFFSLVVFTPAFGQCFLWMDGSIPYLWMMVLGFSYLIPLYKQLDYEYPVIRNHFYAIVYGLLGIVCAWSNITISATIVALYFFKLILYRKAYFWEILASIGSLTGFLFLFLAPGNFVRASDGLVQHSNIIARFFAIFMHSFEWSCFLPLLIVPFVLIALGKVKMTKKILFLFAGFVLIHFSMIGAPYYSDRVRIGPLIFAIMLCGHVLFKIKVNNMRSRLMTCSLSLVLLLSSAQALLKARYDILSFYYDTINREIFIIEQKALGETDIEIDSPYIPETKYCGGYGLDKLTEDPSFWVNLTYAHYYGVNSVRTK